MGINARWHKDNRMPGGATMSQKAEWHVRHQKSCGCRPIPEKVLEYIRHGKQKQRHG